MKNQIVKSIYAYDNYRFFLRDYFREQKMQREIFSHRFFAHKAGFSSSGFCAHVIEGKRNLTLNSLNKMIRGLGIKGKASDYFQTLVFYNQSKTAEEREHHFKKLQLLRKKAPFYKINEKQFAYYVHWYYPVIRELAVYGHWEGDFSRLARLVRPVITPEKARRAVEVLVDIGMLRINSSGKYEQVEKSVTGEMVPHTVTRGMRKRFMELAVEAMETLPIEKRHIASTTVAMSHNKYLEIIEKLDEIRQEILSTAEDEHKVDGVYQFNFQAFPMSQEHIIDRGRINPKKGREQ